MAKQLNGTLRTIVGIFGPLVVLVGAAIGYGVLKGEVGYSTEAIAQIKNALDANATADYQRDKEILSLGKDLEYLRKAADKQAVDVENQRVLLEEILGKITR